MRLQLDDRDGYRKACAGMVERFGRSPAAANDVAWACALGPQALPDLAPAVGLARRAVQSNPTNGDVRNTLGAILYRAGQHQEAVAALGEAIRLNGWQGAATDCLFPALAHFRLGQTDEAKKWLGPGVQGIDKGLPLGWTGRLELQLLRGKAEALLKGPSSDSRK